MRYAACAFNDKPGSRTYDYEVPFHVAPGDIIKVPAARGDGFQKVHVVTVKNSTDVPREFIKVALEIVPPEAEEGWPEDHDGKP